MIAGALSGFDVDDVDPEPAEPAFPAPVSQWSSRDDVAKKLKKVLYEEKLLRLKTGRRKGHDRGRCGALEVESSHEEIEAQARRLAQLLKDASIVVAHTGAGLSTAAGIPDFRGQKGVWTLEKEGEPLPKYERCWDNAVPTLGHMALVGLMNAGLLHGIVSQNVDGLHLRSGIPRDKLCELHGNLFMELCPGCQREYRRTADVGGVGFRPTGRRCPDCGEALVDVLLDWEDELRDYEQAVDLSKRCGVAGGVALCLGTSLQISPSKDLPARASNLVIVNLQPTAKDKRAQLVIRGKIDTVMRSVMEELGIRIPVFRRTETLVVSHTCARKKGDRWKWSIAVGDTADGARCGYVESMTVTFPGTRLIEARIMSAPFRVSRTTKSRAGLSRSGDDRESVEESVVGTSKVESVERPPSSGMRVHDEVRVSTVKIVGDSVINSVAESVRKPVSESVGDRADSNPASAAFREEHSTENFVDESVVGEMAAELIEDLAPSTPAAVTSSRERLGDDREESPRSSGESVEAGKGGEGIITAVIRLRFVAAPGRTAPDGKTVEYVIDLGRGGGSGSREVPVCLGVFDYNS